jgi:hypothetical protein
MRGLGLSQEILRLIDAMAAGHDIRLSTALRLAALLEASHGHDRRVRELIQMLACYRPDGRGHGLGPEALQRPLLALGEYLRS